MAPQARKEGLIVRDMAHELLIYDNARRRAHCLNKTAAVVWRACDGGHDVSEIASRVSQELDVPADKRVVLAALRQLDRARLLDSGSVAELDGFNRARRTALKIGVATLLPVVLSIAAPSAARASSAGRGRQDIFHGHNGDNGNHGNGNTGNHNGGNG